MLRPSKGSIWRWDSRKLQGSSSFLSYFQGKASTGLLERGGMPPLPILVYQLSLLQPEGSRLCQPYYYLPPRFSDLPTALLFVTLYRHGEICVYVYQASILLYIVILGLDSFNIWCLFVCFCTKKAKIFSIWNFIWSNNCVYNHIEIVEFTKFLSVHSIPF